MKLKLMGFVLAVTMFFTVNSSAQTVVKSDTFTFDANGAIIAYDGVVNGYPEEMGSVSFVAPGGSAIDVPWQLGYLNNGYLSPCDPLVWGPKTYSKGDGTHAGDTYMTFGSTTCPYFTGEYGTYENSNNRLEGFSVQADYIMVQHRSCGRRGCIYYLLPALTGGTGTVTDSLIN